VKILFHRHTRASYVYNGCLAWYNVVLTTDPLKREIQVQVCRATTGDSCDGGISVLYDCLLWYKYHFRQLYNMHISRCWVTSTSRICKKKTFWLKHSSLLLTQQQQLF